METKNICEKVKRGIQFHLIDATALLAESTPVLAAFETFFAGMSVRVSLNARILAAGLTYFGGTGYIYAKGRDLSRKMFRIRGDTKERKQHFHDSAYLGAFNLVFAPLLYLASGARDAKVIAIGTATAVAFGLVNGGPMGYVLDMFRDLAGLKECNRSSYPELLKAQSPAVKKALCSLFIVVALALTWFIYFLKNRQS